MWGWHVDLLGGYVYNSDGSGKIMVNLCQNFGLDGGAEMDKNDRWRSRN